ncbi:MAG: hypothetical protein SNJ77_05600 [Cytophagales bacterium]
MKYLEKKKWLGDFLRNFLVKCDFNGNFAVLYKEIVMGVTRLKRKDRRNKAVAARKRTKLKVLTAVPVIKKVDIEELKKQFGSASATA